MLTVENKRLFENYLQSIIERPRSFDTQPHQRDGQYIFCEDWEIIEILKYFINGPEMYRNDPPPNRLKHNPLWSKENIVEKSQHLFDTLGGYVQIVEFFKHERTKLYGKSNSS